jgi:acyl-CoA dehydrogenase
MARAYQVVPIGITVEGANILTRTLIVFGQGALRCHPYAFDEVRAAHAGDLAAFDRAFWGHVGHALTTGVRAFVLAVTAGRFTRHPFGAAAGRHAQRITRISAAFALVSEAAMASLGGELKRRERLTGRLADALAQLYLGSCAVKQFEDDGRPSAEEPLMHWAALRAAAECEDALLATLDNLPGALAWLVRLVAFPLGRTQHMPPDELEARIAEGVHSSLELRARLTRHMYLPPTESAGLGSLDHGLALLQRTAPTVARLRAAVTAGQLAKGGEDDVAEAAVRRGIISQSEREALAAARELQRDLVQVDSFAPPEYVARCGA